MSAVIITTNQTSQYVINALDFVVLMPDAHLTIGGTDLSTGFLADHDGSFTLTVLGDVVTYGKAVVMGRTANPTTLQLAALDVGDDGLVQSLTDTAVEVKRTGSVIDNAGTISGGNAGVAYVAAVEGGRLTNTGTITALLQAGVSALGGAGGALGLFRVDNAGRIEAAGNGISIRYESLEIYNSGEIFSWAVGIAMTDDATLANTLTLVNTGLIQGAIGAVTGTAHADRVTNAGSLVVDVLLGAGDNAVDNGGTVSGAVNAGDGADTVTNSGTISGALSLGGGANRVSNGGSLASLATGAGDDVFVNDGSVAGAVDLGGGANEVTNRGHLDAGLTLGAGDDTLLTTGDITGSVALGDGANTATLDGQLYGGVTAGDGDDTLVILGWVTGAIALGDGANRVTNSGDIAALATGAGDDVFVNDGSVAGAVDLGGGANEVTNRGRLDAGLTLGAGDDTLLTTGFITGDVALGDGGNLATCGGMLTGSITAGAGDDAVRVEGEVLGDLALGDGADSLSNYGRLGGDLDMGTGDDFIFLGGIGAPVVGTIDGGAGNDTLNARVDVEAVVNVETIVLQGGANLSLVADATGSLIYGNSGDNAIDAGAGDDEVRGRRGADAIDGGDGVDRLYGGGGSDELVGGAGGDILTGGRGADVFVYEAATDSTTLLADRIVDFELGRDHVDLSELVGGPIAWLGRTGFSGDGDAEARYVKKSALVKLTIDLDGDGGADMTIVLEGLGRLGADDLFL